MSKTRCAKTVPTSVAQRPSAPRQPPREHGDARQLADPAGQDGVCEQPDQNAEKIVWKRGVRRRHRLVDDDRQASAAHEHRERG